MRVTDPKALKALAHPIRLDLIELLGVLGPATAAVCARHLRSTQASCSFHLRQLAKYGFVEQAPDTGDRRERPWQLTDAEQSWPADSGPAGVEVERVFVQREADRMLRWKASSAGESEPWRSAGFLGGASLPVTPEELTEIAGQLRAVLDPYLPRLTDQAQRPVGARFVRLFLAATPLSFDPETAAPEGDQP
jgi:hypothetical protein